MFSSLTFTLCLSLASLGLVLASTSTASGAEPPPPSQRDKSFAADAASGGMLEVRLGQYASDNAGSEDVKRFGETMVEDHSKANEEFKTICSQKSIELPKVLNPEDQQTLDRLEKLKGPEFDKAYIAQMVQDHQKDIADFEKEATGGTTIRVKGFAQEKLPTLKHHLEMAQAIAKKL